MALRPGRVGRGTEEVEAASDNCYTHSYDYCYYDNVSSSRSSKNSFNVIVWPLAWPDVECGRKSQTSSDSLLGHHLLPRLISASWRIDLLIFPAYSQENTKPSRQVSFLCPSPPALASSSTPRGSFEILITLPTRRRGTCQRLIRINYVTWCKKQRLDASGAAY